MKRRSVIAATATIAATTLSGCLGDDTDGDDSTETADVQSDDTGATDDHDGDGGPGTTDAANDDTEATGESEETESTTEDPTKVLEQNWDAYKNERVEEYISTYHTDSPARVDENWTDDWYWPAEDSSFIIEERNIADQTETTVTIHEKVRGGRGDDMSTWWSIVEIRAEDGDWKVWRYEDVESEPTGD